MRVWRVKSVYGNQVTVQAYTMGDAVSRYNEVCQDRIQYIACYGLVKSEYKGA